MMNITNSRSLLSVGEFAEGLGITVACVRRWLMERKLAHVKVGRLTRIPSTELDRIIEEGYRPAKPRRGAQ